MPPIVDQKTLNTLAIIATVAAAIVFVAGSSFYIAEMVVGRVSPTSFINFAGVLIVFITGEIRKRQALSDTTALKSQVAQVAQVTTATQRRVEDGLADEIADKTTQRIADSTVNMRSEALDAVTANQAAILATADAVKLLLAQVSAQPQALKQALDANTSATDINTAAQVDQGAKHG